MIENAFSRSETLRVSTPSSHGRTIRLVGLKLHSRGVLRAAPDVKLPKTTILRASRAGHHEPPRSRIPERKSAYLAKRAHLQRLQKGTYLITFLLGIMLPGHAKGAFGRGAGARRSPRFQKVPHGSRQRCDTKNRFYFVLVLLEAPPAGGKNAKTRCADPE